MTLRLRQLRLSVMTDNGHYGRSLVFGNGLNILRADNTSGKSTCTQAIIYALGLEAMLSAKHSVPLPHAMKDYLEEEDGNVVNVHESEVWLEIENSQGDQLTVQRSVKGERDNHLVSVWNGPKLSKPELTIKEQDYFVRQPGGAVRSRGFHQLLSEFLGWELPEVTKYDGQKCPLYLECIFPLMLIEQKKGWSGIQTAMPLQFQIKDVRKRAFEFVLDLDAYRNAFRRHAIEQEKLRIRQEWTMLASEINALVLSDNAEIQGLPFEPTAIWPPEVETMICFEHDDQLVSIDVLLQTECKRLEELEREAIPTVAEDAERLTGLLRERSNDLMVLNLAISDVQNNTNTNHYDLEALKRRIETLLEDIAHHKDLSRLKKMGSVESFGISEGKCPTCQQKVEDSLLPQKDQYQPLSVEESIGFLEGQKRTFEVMKTKMEDLSKINQHNLGSMRNQANKIRGEIRSIKHSLVSNSGTPSEAAIGERLHIRHRIEEIEEMDDKVGSLLMKLEPLSKRWAGVLSKEAQISKSILSENDEVKLQKLSDLLCEQLSDYNLRSLDPAKFSVSRDNYHPLYEQFDLGFDLSASDIVRMVWAYLVGILELSRNVSNNHPGLLVLDEPQQQKIKDINFKSLLQRTENSGRFNQQVIIAMTDLPRRVEDYLTEGNYTLLDIQGWILQKLVD